MCSEFWLYTQHFVWKIIDIIDNTIFFQRKIAARQAFWGTDYCNPIRDWADCMLCFNFDKALSATGCFLFLGCSLLGCSWWLFPLVSSELFIILSAVILSKLPLKAFWELSPAQLQNSAIQGNTRQLLGLVFCSFLLNGILATQLSNFYLLFSRDYQNFFWYFCLLIATLLRHFAWILSPLIPHLVLENVPRKSGCRILSHLLFGSLFSRILSLKLLVVSTTLWCL